MLLGAGRETKSSPVDLSAGVLLQKKVGDHLQAGEPMAVLHYNDACARRVEEAALELQQAYTIGAEKAEPVPLIWNVIEA